MFSFEVRGSYDKTEAFLKKIASGAIYKSLSNYGNQGMVALSNATPVDSGETANSWYYEVVIARNTYSIVWRNRHVVDGVPIAIILQYGHGTGTGGYVQGRDYINPAIQPVFDRIADGVWKEVQNG